MPKKADKSPQVFFIELAERRHSFFVGQPVVGRVVLRLPEDKKCKGIAIDFLGEALVDLSGGGSAPVKKGWGTTAVPLIAEGRHRAELWVPPPGKESGALHPGEHVFDFRFETGALASAPASFEGPFGAVRYWLRARLRRPVWADHVAIQPLTLVPVVDACNPAFAAPAAAQKKIELGWSLRPGGSVATVLALPATAFLPGDHVPATVRIANSARHKKKMVTRATLNLVQRCRYSIEPIQPGTPITSGGGRKVQDRTLAQVNVLQQPLAINDTLERTVSVQIPLTAPTIPHAHVLVTYLLHLVIHVPGGNYLHSELPFTVATFRSVQASQHQQHQQHQQQQPSQMTTVAPQFQLQAEAAAAPPQQQFMPQSMSATIALPQSQQQQQQQQPGQLTPEQLEHMMNQLSMMSAQTAAAAAAPAYGPPPVASAAVPPSYEEATAEQWNYGPDYAFFAPAAPVSDYAYAQTMTQADETAATLSQAPGAAPAVYICDATMATESAPNITLMATMSGSGPAATGSPASAEPVAASPRQLYSTLPAHGTTAVGVVQQAPAPPPPQLEPPPQQQQQQPAAPAEPVSVLPPPPPPPQEQEQPAAEPVTVQPAVPDRMEPTPPIVPAAPLPPPPPQQQSEEEAAPPAAPVELDSEAIAAASAPISTDTPDSGAAAATPKRNHKKKKKGKKKEAALA